MYKNLLVLLLSFLLLFSCSKNDVKEVISEPLDCPISVFGGKSDPAISKGMLSGWRTRTNAVFMQHEFPGEHFYLNLEREAVIKTILSDLTHCL